LRKKENKVNGEISKESVIYAHARVEQWLKDYAESNFLPEHEFTLRVLSSIFDEKNGQISRAIYHLSPLRNKMPKRNKTSRSLEMDERTHSKTSRTLAGKRLDGRTQRKGFRYNGTHWMQKPENKAKVIKMMRERRANRMAA